MPEHNGAVEPTPEPRACLHGHATYLVCGVPITAATPAAAAAAIVAHALERRTFAVHLCNAYTLSLVDRDDRLRAALFAGDMNLPDGAPVSWLGRRHGVRGPVRGPSLMRDVVGAGLDSGVRHYFYGGTDGVAAAIAARLDEQMPGVVVVGQESPPYVDLDDAALTELASRIRASGAHIVWVGLGTPRQDYLVPRLAEQVEAAIVPVGAAFDFLADNKPEAPALLHGSGLEWLHRLMNEPRRLWRRYLIGNPRFLITAMKHARRDNP